MPQIFFVVDKSTQTFFYYTRKNPLKLQQKFVCSTGQKQGDKTVEGDKKTPEGVYFTTGRIKGELQVELYGNLAYGLNYPNPVDKIKGKTGYGIWVHGRGKKLVPQDTKGCVALETKDLRTLSKHIGYGKPVIIGQSIKTGGEAGAVTKDIDSVLLRLKEWRLAWQGRDEIFFTYYLAEKFNKAHNNSFSGFMEKKRRLFKQYAWVHVMTNNVCVLVGPDYIVTYFEQYFRSPRLLSVGIKRLYWQKDKDGKLYIVGREWKKLPVSQKDYLNRARLDVTKVVEGWRQSWEKGDLDAYLEYYSFGAEQDKHLGVASIKAHKQKLWSEDPPVRVKLEKPEYSLEERGLRVSYAQEYVSQAGYKAKGRKVLILTPTAKGWRIVKESQETL